MLFTRTPRLAHSTASDLVSWITPALDALYAHWGWGTLTMWADMDAVLMMEPPPCVSIYRPAMVSVKNTLFRLTSRFFFHWA